MSLKLFSWMSLSAENILQESDGQMVMFVHNADLIRRHGELIVEVFAVGGVTEKCR